MLAADHCQEPNMHPLERRLTELVLSAAKLLAKKRAHNKHILQQAILPAGKEGTFVRL